MKHKVQRKRILIIQESLGGGGAEKVLCGILNKFDYSIYDVTLLLWSKTGVYLDKLPKNVKIVCAFGQQHHFFEKLLFRTPQRVGDYVVEYFLKRLEIYSQRFDVIISFLEGVSARLHSLMLNQGLRNISWVHTDMNKNRWSDRYFPYGRAEKFYNTIDDVVFVSNGAMTAFERVFKTGSRHSVIYNIQEPDKIRMLGSESVDKPYAKFTVCCVGRLVRQKRYDRVVRIAAILKDMGYEISFRIVGDGPLKEDLIRLVKEYGVEDMIEFVGFQSNPYKYMSSADMFLLTSESEGYSLVVGEALSLGKPIVSTKVVGPMELLANDAGILCNEDEPELAEAIISLYKDKSLRDKYSYSAINRSKIFDAENTMKQIYSLLS